MVLVYDVILLRIWNTTFPKHLIGCSTTVSNEIVQNIICMLVLFQSGFKIKKTDIGYELYQWKDRRRHMKFYLLFS